ncbi:hypothetical protein LNV09_15930 [Paucibacter sp. B2R-40]|uniref:hypothetical protein n=1 Tax=Paucibacter sp. B2R-40 TaxID=2893554 RepID=UPI0021E4D1D8|nr:hypothetical protein [Paucibacter sp. B2R-40]MCV2355633.1 hypothetical protein [Paucibacter sp. B2R-40]
MREPRLSFVLLHEAMVCITQDQIILADHPPRCHADPGLWPQLRARLLGLRAFMAPRGGASGGLAGDQAQGVARLACPR